MGQPEGSEGQPGGGTDGRTDERTDGNSPHSTGLRPLPGPLPKKCLKGPRRASDGFRVPLKALERLKPQQGSPQNALEAWP